MCDLRPKWAVILDELIEMAELSEVEDTKAIAAE